MLCLVEVRLVVAVMTSHRCCVLTVQTSTTRLVRGGCVSAQQRRRHFVSMASYPEFHLQQVRRFSYGSRSAFDQSHARTAWLTKCIFILSQQYLTIVVLALNRGETLEKQTTSKQDRIATHDGRDTEKNTRSTTTIELSRPVYLLSYRNLM